MNWKVIFPLHSDSNNTLESIKTLLKEVENVNELFKWSNDMTQKQMQQMESFMDKLNEFLMKAEKGGEK